MGALTAKPFSFNYRPWELRNVYSVDVFDTFGAQIRIDVRGNEVIRIVPSLNDALNECWITDKVRFCIDGLIRQRIITPTLKIRTIQNKVSLEKFLETFSETFLTKGRQGCVLIGNDIDLETLSFGKKWFLKWLQNVGFYLQDGGPSSADFRKDYLNPDYLLKLEKADFYINCGVNLRKELPLLDLKIRRSVKDKPEKQVFFLGTVSEGTYKFLTLSQDAFYYGMLFLRGKSRFSRLVNKKASVFFYSGRLFSEVNLYIKTLEGFLRTISVSFIRLYTFNSALNFAEEGFYTMQKPGKNFALSSWLFSLGASLEVGFVKQFNKVFAFSHHGEGLEEVDFVLPTPLFVEKQGTTINLEGLVQTLEVGVTPGFDVRSEWTHFVAFDVFLTIKMLLRGFSKILKEEFFRDSLVFLKDFSLGILLKSLMPGVVNLPRNIGIPGVYKILVSEMSGIGYAKSIVFRRFWLKGTHVANFFQTHVITRTSLFLTLAEQRFERRNFK